MEKVAEKGAGEVKKIVDGAKKALESGVDYTYMNPNFVRPACTIQWQLKQFNDKK